MLWMSKHPRRNNQLPTTPTTTSTTSNISVNCVFFKIIRNTIPNSKPEPANTMPAMCFSTQSRLQVVPLHVLGEQIGEQIVPRPPFWLHHCAREWAVHHGGGRTRRCAALHWWQAAREQNRLVRLQSGMMEKIYNQHNVRCFMRSYRRLAACASATSAAARRRKEWALGLLLFEGQPQRRWIQMLYVKGRMWSLLAKKVS